MLNTKDIKTLLVNKILKGPVKDAGENCPSGRYYVELRNVCFQVDKPYIFALLKKYDRIDPQWYVENYEPKLGNQLENVVDRILKWPETRQAVILMSDENGMMTDNVCTMYMHIMLDKAKDGSYDMDYIVHMRSSDVVEFGNDFEWHFKIAAIINYKLVKAGLNVNNEIRFIWNADTFHMYDSCYNKILDKMHELTHD